MQLFALPGQLCWSSAVPECSKRLGTWLALPLVPLLLRLSRLAYLLLTDLSMCVVALCCAGGNGRPVGEWYVQMGLEAPKKPRDKDIHNATSPAVNVFLDRHERHLNKAAGTPAAAAIAAAPTPRSRALRAARHSQAAALASKGRRGRGGADEMGRLAPWDDAAAMAGSDSTRNTSSIYPPDAMGAWGAMYQQQHGLSTAASLAATSSLQFQPGANPLALNSGDGMAVSEDPVAAAVAMDAAALDWSQQQQMEATAAIPAAAAATAYAAAVSGEYAVVPVSSGPSGLPGDTSLAVVEMGAYLQGLRSTPPWRLLPINQRPLIGRQLVPLRQLFIMVGAGGRTATGCTVKCFRCTAAAAATIDGLA